ncbi:thiamine-phosphate kinase [Thermomonas sp.]|uniref:thiamine-phosphate kinase n=1 Tax=Thermomonas sp. TaxID=1971895 RepID=UPI002488FFC8|nr:thiamine-phosphate kinase [Thermomonas sp.]MDI1254265.1 thiamine-phosphate kinase [Thermomonas sp.]
MSTREFELIARIRARVALRDDVVLGIGDDAALLQVPAGQQLVVAMDTLNAGVHFPEDTAPADIGWKALAVNLSDLAAMGAQPAWCTLSLSMPEADTAFVDGFLDGFLALASQHDVALVGGDTTRGPLSICVTVHGFVEAGTALRRDAARIGDDIWVSGTLGDAAGGLQQWRERTVKGGQSGLSLANGHSDPLLRARLDRPTPRIVLGRALQSIAHACIDVSDGQLADLGHLCKASGVGAQVNIDALPASEALCAAFDQQVRQRLQATGGDDYELCFTVAPDARAAVDAVAREMELELTRIGVIIATPGVATRTAEGAWSAPAAGWVHFG